MDTYDNILFLTQSCDLLIFWSLTVKVYNILKGHSQKIQIILKLMKSLHMLIFESHLAVNLLGWWLMTTCYYPHSYATFYSFDHVTFEVQNISKEHSQKIKIFLELMKSTNILVSKNRLAIKLIRLITNDNQLNQSIS